MVLGILSFGLEEQVAHSVVLREVLAFKYL